MNSKQLFLKLKHNFRCTFFDCSIDSWGELFYKTNSKWSKPKHKKKKDDKIKHWIPGLFQVFPDSKKALESCSSLGLKLGVVSNFDNRLETILTACDLLPHFSFLMTSEEARVAKPNPAIFDLALQKCGAPAASVAHVGDHYVKDYLSSRRVGIQGLLLDRHNTQSQRDLPDQHRLTSLEELPSWIQRHMESCDWHGDHR